MTQDTVVVTQEDREAARRLIEEMGAGAQFYLLYAEATAATEHRGFKRCQEQMAAKDAEEGERQYHYFLSTTCPCTAAGRHVHDCPKHGSIKETGNG